MFRLHSGAVASIQARVNLLSKLEQSAASKIPDSAATVAAAQVEDITPPSTPSINLEQKARTIGVQPLMSSFSLQKQIPETSASVASVSTKAPVSFSFAAPASMAPVPMAPVSMAPVSVAPVTKASPAPTGGLTSSAFTAVTTSSSSLPAFGFSTTFGLSGKFQLDHLNNFD